MRVVIFSGTTEGRRLSRELADAGAGVEVCVATEYGRIDQGEYPEILVHAGRMDKEGMAAMLDGRTLCVDATHPYATQVTANIRWAARQAGTVYKRLLRPVSPLPPDCREVPDAARAVQVLQAEPGNILLTTGAKDLTAFAPLGGERLFARVLPLEASLAACRAAGIPAANIIAMQGPFGVELNVALMRRFAIRYLVTKDGGAPGGFKEKLEAARLCGVHTVVLRRPEEDGEPYERVLEFCKEWIRTCR